MLALVDDDEAERYEQRYDVDPALGARPARRRARRRLALVGLPARQLGRDLGAARRRCVRADSPGATAAISAPARSVSGATSISALLRSIPFTTAAATCVGRAGADARAESSGSASAHMPASLMKPGKTVVTPTPLPCRSWRSPWPEGAQAELGGRVDARVRRGHLARDRRDQDHVPAAALDHRRARARARAGSARAGSRRAPGRAPPARSCRASRCRAARRWPRARPRRPTRSISSATLARSARSAGTTSAAPPSSSRSRSSTSARRALSLTLAPRAAQRARDRVADSPGCAREQGACAWQLHASRSLDP